MKSTPLILLATGISDMLLAAGIDVRIIVPALVGAIFNVKKQMKNSKEHFSFKLFGSYFFKLLTSTAMSIFLSPWICEMLSMDSPKALIGVSLTVAFASDSALDFVLEKVGFKKKEGEENKQ